MVLILIALLNLIYCEDSVQAAKGSQEAQAQEPIHQTKRIKPEKQGEFFVVEGPCRNKLCCEPIRIKVPQGKVPIPVVIIKVSVTPDGAVDKVEVKKSSAVEEVDQQLREGARHWCFEKSKQGLDLDITILTNLMK